jgi:predicted RecB family endonuclease
MTTDVYDEVQPTEDRVPRDRWGRPMVTPPNGGKPKAYTRVTTFAGSVEDMYGLGQWQQRMVALGLAKRPDLLLSVSAHEDDKDELNRIAEAAKEAAAASAAATTGTALHRLAERYDRGQLALDDVPESHRADLRAYIAAMHGIDGLTMHGIEEFVVVDDLQVAGTFDRVVEHDGQRYVADIKTGSIEYGAGKMAIQLALYSRGRLYTPGQPDRADTGVSQTAGIIIHLPAGQGRCDLHWIDLRAGWEAVELCERVRAWRKRKGLLAAASFGPAMLARSVVDVPSKADTTPSPASPKKRATKAKTPAEPAPPGILELIKASTVAKATSCPECIDVANNEDPAPWCDCRSGETCTGPCRRRAHAPEDCPILATATVAEVFDATVVSLDEQIDKAATADELVTIWSEHQDEWTAEHTRLAAARKNHLHQRSLRAVS